MEVVPAALGFKPEQVAERMAGIWSVDGLTLQLVDALLLSSSEIALQLF